MPSPEPRDPTERMNERRQAHEEWNNRRAAASPRLRECAGTAPIDERTGQHEAYWVLSVEERGKGFVRPVRRAYRHLTCGTVTWMEEALAETYAHDPTFYGSTFCVACSGHFPVGDDGQFVWLDAPDEKVGP